MDNPKGNDARDRRGQSAQDTPPKLPYWHVWTDDDGMTHQTRCELSAFRMESMGGRAAPQWNDQVVTSGTTVLIATMRANQLRLWFASMAYVLLCALRRIGLHHTPFAKATCGTIRLKLLKIGALVRVSVRRIKVAMASACPAAHAWGCATTRLAAANARASPA